MPAGVYPRKKRIPTCHPDRPYCAKNLCQRCWAKAYSTSAHGRAIRRNRMLLDFYGITLEKYLEMYALQKGICAVCKLAFPKYGSNGLCVDHDHSTGHVRGLLCIKCNTSLSWYETNAKGIVKYLEETNENQVPRTKIRQEQTQPVSNRPIRIDGAGEGLRLWEGQIRSLELAGWDTVV
jgi:hypothetical protein